MRKCAFRFVVLLAVLAIVFGACAPKPQPAPTTAPPAESKETTAPEPTTAPEEPTDPEPTAASEEPTDPEGTGSGAPDKATLEEYANAPREETLILDNPYRLEGGDNWNPLVPGNAAGTWGLSTIGQDPLVLLSYGTGEIENWMAESFTPNDDFSVWTLKLRDGITWNDGVPFTIDDVIYSVELQMNTEPLGAHFTYLEWIDHVEKVDDSTMEFHLKKPNVRFILERYADNQCGWDWVVPKHIWEKVEDPLTFKNFDLEAGLPLGTGPYILHKVTTNEAIWVRNDNWWAAKIGLKKLPAPKKVIYSFAGTEEVRIATGIDNGFDGLQDITLSSFQALIAGNPNWEPFQEDLPYVWPDPCARSLSLNCAIEPWNDKDMRWVLNYVMDRQQIIDFAYEGTSVMGPYPWPLYPSMQKYTDLVPQETLDKFLKPNPAEAERILTEKGYTKNGEYWEKDGKQLSLEIQVHEAFSELERIADVYVEQLQRFGINASKVKLTGQTWGDDFAFGNYEAQSGWQTCGSIMEPWNTLRTMAGEAAPIGERPEGTQNSYRWHNERFTELVEEIGLLGWDDPKLLELTKEALEIYYEELPVIPTAQSKKLIPFNTTYWTNWPTIDNYYQRPSLWCPSFIGVITEIEPAQ